MSQSGYPLKASWRDVLSTRRVELHVSGLLPDYAILTEQLGRDAAAVAGALNLTDFALSLDWSDLYGQGLHARVVGRSVCLALTRGERMDAYSPDFVRSLVAHESYHIARGATIEGLADFLINEGLALEFEASLCPGSGRTAFAKMDPADVSRLLSIALADIDNGTPWVSRWVDANAQSIPVNAAYGVGWAIVRYQLASVPGATAVTLISCPSSDFLPGARQLAATLAGLHPPGREGPTPRPISYQGTGM